MKKLILAFYGLICFYQSNCQSSNVAIIDKLINIENDTIPLLKIIIKPYPKDGAYNSGIDGLKYSIENKSDTFVLKKTLNRIVETNADIFLHSKVKSLLLFNIQHSGERPFYNDILLIKTDKEFYGFFSSSNDEKIYKKIISKQNYLYAKNITQKRYSKNGWGETVLIREIIPKKETKARLIVMNPKVIMAIAKIEKYFKDIIPL